MSLNADLESQADEVASGAPPELLDTMDRGMAVLAEGGVGTSDIPANLRSLA